MRSSFSEARRSSSQQRRLSDQTSSSVGGGGGGAAAPAASGSSSSQDIASIITSPGHALHLVDVRLSLSSVVLSAQTTLQTAAAVPASHPPISLPASSSTNGGAGGISRRLSLFEAAQGGTSNPPPSSSNGGVGRKGGKLRPRSADIGARARDALLDLGRAARELRGSKQRFVHEEAIVGHEVAVPAATTTEEATPLEAEAQVRQARAAAADALEGRSPRITPVVRVRRVLRLRPRVSALLQPPRQGPIPTQILSRLEASDDAVGLWERLDAPPAELVADEEPGLRRTSIVEHDSARAAGVARAGNFYPGPSDSEDAYSDEEAEDEAEEQDALDPARMLLKLASPATAARQRWTSRVPDSVAAGQATLLETHEVRVRVRLRLQPPPFGQATASTPQQSSPHKRTASGSRVTTRLGSSGGRSARQLLFVAAHSSAVLLRALGNSTALRDDSSARAAGLLARVLVPEAGEREQDFEWGFDVAAPVSSHSHFSSSTCGKRACAFVERDDRGNVNLLASFAFFSESPGIASEALRAASATIVARPTPPIVMLQAPDSRRQSSLDVAAPYPSRSRFSGPNTQPFPSSPTSVRIQLPSISGSDVSAAGIDNGGPSKALEVDHTEISLAEVAADSPIFRAALQSLDRRTATLRRAAKAALRAAAAQTQLVNARAAHSALDECLADLAPSAPATLGVLHRDFLSNAFKRQRTGDEEEARMLDECLAAPLRAVLERCRVAQEQSKHFEAESRTYYSQTKQWLSSRSTPVAGSADETVYASTAVGFDKNISKQERNDDKQRLRQAKFDRARLEAYRTATALHGGEAELELARSVHALCLWHAAQATTRASTSKWPSEEATAMLDAFGEQIQVAAARVEERDALAREQADEIEALIARIESGLVKDGELAPAGDTSWMLVGGVNLSDHEALGAATRQAGHKIKHILSSIGGIGGTMQSNTTTIVPSISMASTTGGDSAPDEELLVAPQETPTRSATSSSAATAAGLRKKVSLKLSSSATASPVFGALQRLRGTNAPADAGGEAISPNAQAQFVKLPPLSPYGEHVLASSNKASPSSRRASPRLSQTMLDYTAGRMPSVGSPRTTDRSSPKMQRSSSDVARPAFLRSSAEHQTPVRSASSGLGIGGVAFGTPPDQASPLARTAARFGDVSPAVTASMERKKEGMLWVLSKPIQGAGGADAPRGVNRSAAWREAWVVLSGSGMLGEYAAWRESKILEPSQPLIDLRFATVREGRGVERRFTFEVVTRDSRRFFQAPDEVTMRDWIGAIQKAIESLLNGTSSVRQIDKVARSSEYGSPSFGAGDDFGMMGSGAGLRAFGATPVPIGQSKAFSQSLTDLSSVASARLFNRQSDSHRNAKRDSRTGVASPTLAAHLSTLSEASSSKGMPPVTPTRPTHERGISNRTPVSGYVLNEGASASSWNLPSALRNHTHLSRKHGTEASEAGTSVSSEVESDFDARIAELVQSSYGGSTTDLSGGSAGSNSNPAAAAVAQHRRSSTLDSSPAMSRQTSSAASSGQGKVRMRVERINSASSTKISRAAEVARISRLPENSNCADCRSNDPRWASWALNGQPCCIFICIACSGVHRSLGVQVSKVKSVDLDDWTVEQMEAARTWGNERVNAYYEHARPAESGPSPHFTRDKTFWLDKYVHKRWAKEGSLVALDEMGPASPNGSAGARLRPAGRRSSSSFNANQAVHEEDEEASRSTRDSTPKALVSAQPRQERAAISTSPTTFVSLLSSHLGPPTLDTRPAADYLPPVMSPSVNSSTSSVSVVTASPIFNAAANVAPSTPSRSRTRSHSTPHHSPAATALQAAL